MRNDGEVIIGTSLDTKSFDAQIDYVKQQMEEIEYLLEKADAGEEIGKDTTKLEAQYEVLSNKLRKLVDQKQQLENGDIIQVRKSIDNIGKSLDGIVKKAVKWGLAVFSIRSAYMGIRQAISQVMQEDENLKYQIDYMKYSLGQAIKPIVEFIVGLVYKILVGVGGIIKLLFGINIFAKATKENFKSANTNAKELKKTLMGFDEANILNADGSMGVANKINDALSGFEDINKAVDEFGKNFKKWFWGTDNPDEQNFLSALKRAPQMFVDGMKQIFIPLYDTIINPYFVTPLLGAFDYIKEASRPIWEPIKNSLVETINNSIKPKWNELIEFMNEKIKVLEPIWEPIHQSFIRFKDGILQLFAPFLNTIIDWINNVFGAFGVHLDRIEVKVDETGTEITNELGGAIDEVGNKAEDLSNQSFDINIFSSSIGGLFDGVTSLWDRLKELGAKIWEIGVKYTTNTSSSGGFFNNMLEGLRGALSKVGINFAKGGVVTKLARGAIANKPGGGIPTVTGNARWAEAGAEAYLPLTDEQVMSTLGQAIGRNVVINAEINNNMNGRLISRELQKVTSNDDFAYNR